MNKDELLKHEIKKFKKRVKSIKALPGNATELGFNYICDLDTGALLVKDIHLQDLKSELHNLRLYYGDYILKQYWIPFEGCVCIKYTVKHLAIRFSINTDNAQEVIDLVSNGRCKVVETTSITIQCEVPNAK